MEEQDRQLVADLDRAARGSNVNLASVIGSAKRAGRPEVAKVFSYLTDGVARRDPATIAQARRLAAHHRDDLLTQMEEEPDHVSARAHAVDEHVTPAHREEVMAPARVEEAAPRRVAQRIWVRASLFWKPELDEEAAFHPGVLDKLGEMYGALSEVVDDLGTHDPDAEILEELGAGASPDGAPSSDPAAQTPGAAAARKRTVLRVQPPALTYRIDQLPSLAEWVDNTARTVQKAHRAGRHVTLHIVCGVKISAAATPAREAGADARGGAERSADEPGTVIKLVSVPSGAGAAKKAPPRPAAPSSNRPISSFAPATDARAASPERVVELTDADYEIVNNPDSWAVAQ